MSSTSDYQATDSCPSPSDKEAIKQPSPPPRRQSRMPMTPRKRRRLDSASSPRARNYTFEGRYNDAYRELYNATVQSAAARIEPHDAVRLHTSQIGSSTWSSDEKARFFAALERLGKDDTPGIAHAVATKSVPETRQLLLLLHDAATNHRDLRVTLRDVPAAIEVGSQCEGHLDMLAEALAWYQEMYEASQEQARFGEHWLITSELASRIDDAFSSDRSRAGSSVPPSGSEGRRRGGRVIPGACASCKLHKQRCDRATPCGTCVRRKLEPCIYPTPSRTPSIQPSVTRELQNSKTPEVSPGKSAEDIMQAIPEAHLLSAETMLTLSRNVFMNRSPSISSSWPHWSEIRSDFTDEPAIYRSAFHDFHTLAVSVTKRLMQTAIMQATSRLRSQRHRTKKGAIPLVKRRDVLAAIDVVGMKRNGKQRWQGVARRCALRVFQPVSRRGKGSISRREVPWHEVEKMMAPAALFAESFATDTEASDHSSSSFKRRAMRSGTPLPFRRLALADSQEDSDRENSDNSSVSTPDDISQTDARPLQPIDLFGRQTSVPPTADQEPQKAKQQTIEQFDQAARREEERALWEILKLQAPAKHDENLYDEDAENDLELTEKVVTDADGWRSWIEYRPEWEELDNPIPHTKFSANMKPFPSPYHMAGEMQHDQSMSSPNHHSSSGGDATRRKRNMSKSVELRIQDPPNYAAQQEQITRFVDDDEDSGEEDTSSIEPPTQSIEVANGPPCSQRDDSMDWDAYMDL